MEQQAFDKINKTECDIKPRMIYLSKNNCVTGAEIIRPSLQQSERKLAVQKVYVECPHSWQIIVVCSIISICQTWDSKTWDAHKTGKHSQWLHILTVLNLLKLVMYGKNLC